MTKTIALIGPYQIHNFGDDLIGCVLVRAARERFAARVLVPGLSRDNARWLEVPWCDNSKDAVRAAVGTLIGGGGILGDSGVTPHNRYLARGVRAALFSRALGRRVAITAVGAGPLMMRSSRLLCRVMCAASSAVGVRDAASQRFLVDELGVSPSKVTAGADVALLWPDYLAAPAQHSGSIGVQFDTGSYAAALANPAADAIVSTVEAFCARKDLDIRPVSNGAYDTAIVRGIPNSRPTLRYSLMPEFLAHLSGLRAIVTSHLHLAIAAYAVRVPCFSIYVRQKTERFYEQIGHSERALAFKEATPEAVQNLLDQAVAANWTRFDEENLQRLRGEAERLIGVIPAVI